MIPQQPLLKSPSRTPVMTRKNPVSSLVFFRPMMAKNIQVKKFLGLDYEMKRLAWLSKAQKLAISTSAGCGC